MFTRYFQRWNTQKWYRVNNGSRVLMHSWERFEKANVISSETINGTHNILLDIDMPVEIYESTTPGNFHLYINKELQWGDYLKLLVVLNEVGIISNGYFEASMVGKATFLRLPWIMKHENDGLAFNSENTPSDDKAVWEIDATPSNFEDRSPFDEI